eukprot:TRINITY_DN485_c0_g2_i1.p1 TRINITY_DN485_c0_g2~~TRINITY_DN485_c0_g2_i1.p1  ORF type:complete len:498 (-),score=163.24 TRINITY_DN485_c0_g2_i1:107-1600(-)
MSRMFFVRRRNAFFIALSIIWLLSSLYFSGYFASPDVNKGTKPIEPLWPAPVLVSSRPEPAPSSVPSVKPVVPVQTQSIPKPRPPPPPPPPSEANTCIHTINRDYNVNPVQFELLQKPRDGCDVPCHPGSGDISRGAAGRCPHIKAYEFTMENGGRHDGTDQLIAGNTRLDSDVPIQYFSWEEYDFMRRPRNKTAESMMVAVISNCGPQMRLDYLQALQSHGVTVDSFGRCANNKPFPTKLDDGDIGEDQKFAFKEKLVSRYKFTFAFENSEGEDYVSEKMWGVLAAGSVPVYWGGRNARKYVPSNRSVIFMEDYKDAADMAEHLKKLAADDALYNEYMRWKYDGPSKDFIATVDLSLVHSECRFCIRSADIDRKLVGEVVTGPHQDENDAEMRDAPPGATMLKVRERGKFWLRRVHIGRPSIAELRDKILAKYSNSTTGDIYSVYRLWDRTHTPLTTDAHVASLTAGEELEIIFENPNLERFGYSRWLEKRKQSEQ